MTMLGRPISKAVSTVPRIAPSEDQTTGLDQDIALERKLGNAYESKLMPHGLHLHDCLGRLPVDWDYVPIP